MTGIRRRAYQLIAALYLAALVGSVSMVAGPYLNDRAIASDPARALGIVTAVSPTRTTVSFQDELGRYHSPKDGLRYPTGLGKGQKVWVEYQASNPDLVKVLGREWTLSIIPALSVAAIATLIAALCWWLAGRTNQRPFR
ncbi:membrane protein [Corynebacterium phocae]|uniref:Membrane protein n=1 Tax=Corynebacterium phocae TaxID=161895 RepID=A0A1L7D6I9_9CORY|nr:DUF3592 domain-containing protein [Corynebacterium phocae]APT93603.1 membrane protein [Corynebacterium phocae]KAA8727470.1 DUF3592 domain-containing protein [Corynebacterium phocae]